MQFPPKYLVCLFVLFFLFLFFLWAYYKKLGLGLAV